MTKSDERTVTVELKGGDDYKLVHNVLVHAGLRPLDEHWPNWVTGGRPQITLTFSSQDDAESAKRLLSDFLPLGVVGRF
jgi:hypothetical protein